jgi:hypothetical protein
MKCKIENKREASAEIMMMIVRKVAKKNKVFHIESKRKYQK